MKKRLFAALLILAVAIGLTIGLGLRYQNEKSALQTARAAAEQSARQNAELTSQRDAATEKAKSASEERLAQQKSYEEWKEWHSELEQMLG